MVIKNRKFLYISFMFPPLAGPEPRYNLSVIRRLCSKGFIPTIITAPEDYRYPKDEYLRSLIPKDIEIKKCEWPYKYEIYTNAVRRLLKIPGNPLIFKGWRRLYRLAKDATKKNDYEFIYSVHGIGAAHLAALKLKKDTGLPWIADFRDPWIYNVVHQNYMEDKAWRAWSSYQYRKTEKYLAAISNKADLIIVESPMHGEYIVRDFKIDDKKVLPLGAGYENNYFDDIKIIPIQFAKRPVIGYVGNIYYGYEDVVESFVKSLKEVEKLGYEFTLIVVGDTSDIFSKHVNKFGLKNYLPISRVEYDTSLSLMALLDFGLVITSRDYKMAINSKSWEYMRSNLSIIGVVPEDGGMARIIDHEKCGYIIPYDVESATSVLIEAFNDYQESKVKRADQKLIEKFSRENLIDELIENIERIV